MGEEEPLQTLSVELQNTRPTLVYIWKLGGIPTEAAAMLVLVFGELFIAAKIWWVIFLFLTAWWFVAKLVSRDYHAITVFNLYVQTSLHSYDASTMGGAGPGVWPSRSRQPRGI
jgi:type IV secretory pathway VirB3-like protein